MTRRKSKSDNEKVAEKMTLLVNDLTLDLELIGQYIANSASNVTYRRFVEIAEAARYEREEKLHGTDFIF